MCDACPMMSKSSHIISLLGAVVAAGLILMSSGGMALESPNADPLHFPAVEGVNLNNVAQVLPRDFKGQLNLVLMAFRRDQQAQIDSWLPELRQLALEQPGLGYYELPVIGPKVAPLRWIIRNGMRSGVKDQVARARTILVFSDKPPLLKPLDIVSEESIVVLLLNDRGRVIWRSAGPWVKETGDALRRAVEAGKVSQP